jgi:hypothetical protein
MKNATPDQTQRFLWFEYDDGTSVDIEIGKATVVKTPNPKMILHLDRTQDGKHLLICSQEIWPEGKLIDNVRMIRNG